MSKLLVIMNKATKLVQKWYLFECQRQRKWIAMKRDVGCGLHSPSNPLLVTSWNIRRWLYIINNTRLQETCKSAHGFIMKPSRLSNFLGGYTSFVKLKVAPFTRFLQPARLFNRATFHNASAPACLAKQH